MAVKGLGYTKTTWAFQERPVASAKLNLWDDRLEAALELIFRLLSLAWGGGDGVVQGGTIDDLKVAARATPGMDVEVQPGYAFISGFPFRLASVVPTAAVAAPTVHPRIDLVQARLGAWDVSVKAGAEAVSPSVPGPDTDAIALATLHLRPGMTCIKGADDGVNGYIVDARMML